MQHVLLLVNEEAHIRELARVADVLRRTPDLRPVVFMEDRLGHLGVPPPFAERGIEVLTSESLTIGSIAGSFALGPWTAGRLIANVLVNVVHRLTAWMPARLRQRLDWLRVVEESSVAVHRRSMLRRAAVSDAALSSRSYLALVMSEDNVELDTGVWISMARRHGVRSIIIPYTISNTAEFAESYVHHEPYQVGFSGENRRIAALFPAWALTYKHRRFLRSTGSKIVAVEQLGLAPPNPWLLNSGFADAIAVESAAMREYYRAAGIPDEQLVVTGSLTDDIIVTANRDRERRRRELLAQAGRLDDRPLLLCALPPDQNTYDRPGCEFRDFDDLIGFWGDSLAAVKGWNVVIRPHPKTRPDRLHGLAARGLAVSWADTAMLMPLCDMYVASVSATIRWAIACGKPVLNYDVYRYGYEDYRAVEGVVLVDTREQFRTMLMRLTGDEATRSSIADAQRREADRWGKLDGASARRILALLGRPDEVVVAA